MCIRDRGLTVIKGDGTLLNILRPGEEGAAGTSPTTFVADELSGNWETRTSLQVLSRYQQPEISWSLTDKGLAAVESYDELSMSPSNNCVPQLPPWIMLFPAVKRIEIGEEVTMIRSDEAPPRTVHMNLDSHEGAPYTNQGHSIGWWEDDVLVVDTAHFSEHRTGNSRGLPSGRQRHHIERSELNEALTKHINNPRVSKITFAVSFDACTPGRNLQGTYSKQDTPAIPLDACSRIGGCNCRYIPVLTEIFP